MTDDGPRILAIDIETTPNLAHVWRLFNIERISLSQLMETSRVFCFGARWLGDESVEIRSEHRDGQEYMLQRIHDLMDEADVIMGWNSQKFDVKRLNTEFLIHDMMPPSPFLNLDLMLKTKQVFGFTSNKLDFVAQQLKVGKKVAHEGHELWVKCMAGDEEAWEKMYEYQKQDVDLLIDVYEKLQPWIKGHPNYGLFTNQELVCTNCGSDNMQKRGFAYSGASRFQRYRCMACGKWDSDSKRDGTTRLRG